MSVVAALTLPAVPALSAELFAPGVTKDSGWYDTNKVFDSQDYNLCWAATDANVIKWWLDSYERGGGDLSNITEKTAKEIFQNFKDNWNNVGYNNVEGLNWYFTGKFSSGSVKPSELKNANTGGYLADLDGVGGRNAWGLINGDFQKKGVQETGKVFISDMTGNYYPGEPLYTHEDFSQTILEQLTYGASMLSVHKVHSTVSSSGHSITLWGCEYDEVTNLVTKIYVTDSDDKYDGLKSYTITKPPSGNGVMMDNYWYSNDQYGRITASSMLYAAYIPEPSAFGMIAGIISLVFVVSRRRRK